MKFKTTKVFDRIVRNFLNRVQILQGGTSSSKTWSILQYLIYVARVSPVPLLISIVSESFPHLRRGVIRDFIKILGGDYNPKSHNASANEYKIGLCTFEFFSVDKPSKQRGARRDILFINECNNIPYEAYNELEPRTLRKVFLDFNPVRQFWVHEFLVGLESHSFDISTYQDNTQLDQRIVQAIERRKATDSNWWRVYGQGLIGSIEGLVFPEFDVIPDDEWPKGMLTNHGLDFGFTNDPTALVETGFTSENFHVHEKIYENYLTNQDIAARFEKLGMSHNDPIYGDCSEPKSVEEIYRLGWDNIHSSSGTRDFYNFCIDYIHNYRIKVTESSVNTIKELRNYSYMKDKYGKYINRVEDGFDHSMTAMLFTLTDKIEPPQIVSAGNLRHR